MNVFVPFPVLCRPAQPCVVLCPPLSSFTTLCLSVPSCALLHRPALSYAVLYRPVLSYAVLYRAMPSCVVLYHRVPSCTVPYDFAPSCAIHPGPESSIHRRPWRRSIRAAHAPANGLTLSPPSPFISAAPARPPPDCSPTPPGRRTGRDGL